MLAIPCILFYVVICLKGSASWIDNENVVRECVARAILTIHFDFVILWVC